MYVSVSVQKQCTSVWWLEYSILSWTRSSWAAPVLSTEPQGQGRIKEELASPWKEERIKKVLAQEQPEDL